MDNRKTTRLPLSEEITYTYNDRNYKGEALDISQAGIRFTAGQFIPPMSPLQITVDIDRKITFTGVTIWSSKNGGTYSVGVLFRDLDEDLAYQLTMLLNNIGG